MATTMTVKGQVTIPKAVREAAGIKPGDQVEVRSSGKGVLVTPVQTEDVETRFAEHLKRIQDVARRSAFSGFTTEELMALTRGED